MLYKFKNLIHWINYFFSQPHYLHLLFAILKDTQLGFIGQQIEDLPTVDLKETCRYHQVQDLAKHGQQFHSGAWTKWPILSQEVTSAFPCLISHKNSAPH